MIKVRVYLGISITTIHIILFQNTFTHKDKQKKKSFELEWEPPVDYVGPITFK